MKPTDKVFWLRVVMGTLTGVLLGALKLVMNLVYEGVLIAVFIYMTSYYLARIFLYSNIPPNEVRKLVTTGLVSFIMFLLFTWILIYTLFRPG